MSSPQLNNEKKIKRKQFTPDEDYIIIEKVRQFGYRWPIIAKFLDGRNSRQVRDRYTNYLNPGINKKQWTEKEDNTLKHLVLKYGCKWKTISLIMGERSEVNVRNRYRLLMRHKALLINHEIRSSKIKNDDEKESEKKEDSNSEDNSFDTDICFDFNEFFTVDFF
ncbi:Myb-like DNA-binding domain containing protein [Trichomonas vaginalis G3]|uniref:Myb-like DNA-binding domain containing protein n=1 Tax=Trichomonas vaginalis (strain ATCC PRA-98 / G3) TaxID=412133 RepID=A2EBJ3_TRIV3|nr:RNA polymerase II transcription regulator recruiting protein [Trichomonas vaginalis G3]EAY10023.1 Myb-like DNA-binding domain containing protein [Trichomonas vaginalis G3]KAI5535103.1 RNA polymerase II transcription regulator recruiting protein [Trichomonas vaginalis G3]|eukprot:XP_001322246.1 Myb-like DNA-binding domain containing protein [Trichomonas vaginalis G3]